MKQIALLALTLALVSSSAAAQKPAAADAKPKWTEHLAEHFAGLTLTADQKDKIAAANKRHHDAMDKIKATEKDEKVRNEKVKEHQTAEHAEFHEILTAEQYAVFEKNMAKMEEHEKMAKKKPGAMDHDKMDKMDHDKMDHDKMDKAATKPVKKP